MDLHTKHISHGDIQQDNIIVNEDVNGKIHVKLIDYDSLCVPALAGRSLVTSGYADFQHPQRIKKSSVLVSSEKDDYFSEKIVLASLQLLGSKPQLWKDSKVDIESNEHGLLFRADDFDNFKECYLYKQGIGTSAEKLLNEIAGDLEKDLEDIKPYLDNYDRNALMRLVFYLQRTKEEEEKKKLVNDIVKKAKELASEDAIKFAMEIIERHDKDGYNL